MREFFPKIFGNDAVKQRIGRAILDSRLPHALLIDGGEGSGKLTLAKSIAAAINCEHKTNQNRPLPCHDCPSCRKIFGDGHVDVHVTELDSSRATIGVNEIKDLRSDMFLTSTEAEFKVYIIRDAEKMTPAAQNALLIVLEEPPKNVVIILLSSGSDKILTTIKSRAQYIPMSRLSRSDISDFLVKSNSEAQRLSLADHDGFMGIVNAADGRIGQALELITPEGRAAVKEEREETLAIIQSLSRGKTSRDTLTAIDSLPQKRAELSLSLERIMMALSDLIRQKYDSDDEPRFFTERDEAAEYANQLSTQKLFKVYDLICAAYDANSKNANTAMLLTALAADIRRA